jgi:hypothetical protein
MSNTPPLENPSLTMEAIEPKCKLHGYNLPTPSAEADLEQAKSERSNPLKKQRNGFHKCTATYPNEAFLKMVERLRMGTCRLQHNCPIPAAPASEYTEVKCDTRYARYKGPIDNITIGVLDPLRTRQRYFRQGGQNEWFKKRSEKLLKESWETQVDLMMFWLKNGVKCRNCEKHHETDILFKNIEDFGLELKMMDANKIDQASLENIKARAVKIGDEYVDEVGGMQCMSNRRMWQEKPVEIQTRVREDSGVDISMDVSI